MIQQALHTRTLADQSWERYELVDDWSRDADMPSRGPASYPPELLAGASAYFSAMAAARVRRHRRALQRLAHVRATRAVQVCTPRDTGSPCASARGARPHTAGGQPLPTMKHLQ